RRVRELRSPVTEVVARRNRVERREVWLHDGVDANQPQTAAAVGQEPAVSVGVGHARKPRDAEPLTQSFVASEEEQLVLHDRATQRAAELIPLERRWVVDFVEVALSLEGAVTQELERLTIDLVRSRFGDGADDAAGRAD